MFELYEDNAGRIHLFKIDSTGSPVWGWTYYGDGSLTSYSGEEMAAMDWVGVYVQCLDPVRECWDSMPTDELEEDYRQCEDWAALIACDMWHKLPLGIDERALGCAGREMLRAINEGVK